MVSDLLLDLLGCFGCLVVLAVWRLGEILRPPDLWIGVAWETGANKMGLGIRLIRRETTIHSSRTRLR